MADKKRKSKVVKSFYVHGISFDTLQEYVAIKKVTEGFTMQEQIDHTNSINHPDRTPEKKIIKAWESVKPMTLKKANKLYQDDPRKIKLIELLLNKEITWDSKKRVYNGTEKLQNFY